VAVSDVATAAQQTDALCEARGVGHDFMLPNGNPLRVLEDIHLAVGPKEVVALLGPSGCGKSTLLRILAGLLAPRQGQVLDHGRPLTGLNPGVAFVFQGFALLPWLTVTGNVQAVLRVAGLPAAEAAERAGQAIRLVGLAGFEDAYPRELSGGMKQRVGMARALAVDPEILFLDEPFSQVDALTAASLRAEVLDLWSAQRGALSSVLLVSHDVHEVVAMADRIVVLATSPGRVRTVVDNRLPRPRDYRSGRMLELVDYLQEVITRTEMPDVPVNRGPAVIEPLPEAPYSEIIGLLEYLEARGGREDIFRIADDTRREYGRVMTVAQAAELLDFVSTPRRLVVLTREGQDYVGAAPEERKTLWRDRLLRLRLFRDVHDVLQREPRHQVDRDFVLETLVMNLPQENYERQFATLVGWARSGDLFVYDEGTQTLSLA
jgi:NitT/TauT family transport system ATP-binding protein